jgi:hypothetical protein
MTYLAKDIKNLDIKIQKQIICDILSKFNKIIPIRWNFSQQLFQFPKVIEQPSHTYQYRAAVPVKSKIINDYKDELNAYQEYLRSIPSLVEKFTNSDVAIFFRHFLDSMSSVLYTLGRASHKYWFSEMDEYSGMSDKKIEMIGEIYFSYIHFFPLKQYKEFNKGKKLIDGPQLYRSLQKSPNSFTKMIVDKSVQKTFDLIRSQMDSLESTIQFILSLDPRFIELQKIIIEIASVLEKSDEKIDILQFANNLSKPISHGGLISTFNKNKSFINSLDNIFSDNDEAFFIMADILQNMKPQDEKNNIFKEDSLIITKIIDQNMYEKFGLDSYEQTCINDLVISFGEYWVKNYKKEARVVSVKKRKDLLVSLLINNSNKYPIHEKSFFDFLQRYVLDCLQEVKVLKNTPEDKITTFNLPNNRQRKITSRDIFQKFSDFDVFKSTIENYIMNDMISKSNPEIENKESKTLKF